MNVEIVVALISFGGVALSAILAFLIGRKQARVEIDKVRLEIKAIYQEKLYEKRLQVYPQLYEILGDLGGKILEGYAMVDDVKSTWNAIRVWDRQNALFLSPFSTRTMIALRQVIIPMSKLPQELFSKTKQREKLLPALIEMQMSLKTELGVLHFDGFHSPAQLETLRNAIPKSSDENKAG